MTTSKSRKTIKTSTGMAPRALRIVSTLIGAVLVTIAAVAEENSRRSAEQILQEAQIFDGHNDLPWTLRDILNGRIDAFDFNSDARFDTDLSRLREGYVGAQFWSVFVPMGLSTEKLVVTQLEQIETTHRLIERYDNELHLALSIDDIREAQQKGKIASLLGIEGGHTIGNSIGVLRSYYRLGVRYMTLTHTSDHGWAGAASSDPDATGLSSFGKEVVLEMNRLGMLVDLSHVSDQTMRDALDVSTAPVIFSHSGARSLTNHPRNVPDEILLRVASNGGVVMVPFIPPFVNEERRIWAHDMEPLLVSVTSMAEFEDVRAKYMEAHGEPPLASIEDVADHIDYIANLIGHDHVGIGADFYGQKGADLVQGLEDVSKYPALIEELLQRGWHAADIAKLNQGNILRVMESAERMRN